jgi:ribosome biogenesis protein ERB1
LFVKGGDGEDEESTPDKIEPVVCLQWNPNRTHHILLAACGKCAFIIGTGTGGAEDAELTDALLSNCASGKSGITNPKTQQAVKWVSLKKGTKNTTDNEPPLSAFGMTAGLVAATVTTRTVVSASWHKKGDYFVTVSPKAAAASVLIHQLSKASSQQPFRKAKGETQAACFHPTKPFLFVASQQHIRVYHLVKQTMVKRKYFIPHFLLETNSLLFYFSIRH